MYAYSPLTIGKPASCNFTGKMMAPSIRLVREKIAWSYANLARAHAAVSESCDKYSRVHHIIRTKLYFGLVSGQMSMRSIFDDERIKLSLQPACSYCGDQTRLALDDLIPRIKGGPDEADNLVLACRSCNSSKQGRDLLAWMDAKKNFPSLLVLRRYLKIVSRYCEREGHLDREIDEMEFISTPFDIRMLPIEFPPLAELTLLVKPRAIDAIAKPA